METQENSGHQRPIDAGPHAGTAPGGPPPVRIGVLGAGLRITTVLQGVLAAHPGIRITAVCDVDPGAVERFRREAAPGAEACPDAVALCRREDVDWVFIGSFNCHHAEHTIAAFEAGKHVFCEKPLALTLEDALRMEEARKASGRIFALGLVLRYSPLYRKIKSLLDAGEIGQIQSFEFNETLVFNHGGYIHGNWRRHRHLAGTHLLEKCCHDVDLALWLVEDLPVRVASFGGCSFFVPKNASHAERIGPSPDGKPAFQSWPDPHGISPFSGDKSIFDQQVAILEFSRGVRATFHTNCHASIPERRFYLIGTEGTLRADAYTGQIEVRRMGWEEPLVVHQPIQGDGHAGGDATMARELAQALVGQRTPAAGILEGVRSLTTILAIDAAAETSSVVDLRDLWQEAARITGDPASAKAAAMGRQPAMRK